MKALRLAAMLLLCVPLAAQWLNYKTPGVPRTRDGKPKLNAPAPRTVDGHPDLTGVWMHETTTVAEVRRLFGDRFDDDFLGDRAHLSTERTHGLVCGGCRIRRPDGWGGRGRGGRCHQPCRRFLATRVACMHRTQMCFRFRALAYRATQIGRVQQ